MWQGRSDTGEVVLGALELFTVSDEEIDALGVEYSTGGSMPVGSTLGGAGDISPAGKIKAGPELVERAKTAAPSTSGERDEDTSWTVMQPPKAENVNLGVQLALGGVVTAALVGAGAWLYLRRGHSKDGSKGNVKR